MLRCALACLVVCLRAPCIRCSRTITLSKGVCSVVISHSFIQLIHLIFYIAFSRHLPLSLVVTHLKAYVHLGTLSPTFRPAYALSSLTVSDCHLADSHHLAGNPVDTSGALTGLPLDVSRSLTGRQRGFPAQPHRPPPVSHLNHSLPRDLSSREDVL